MRVFGQRLLLAQIALYAFAKADMFHRAPL